jgi:hypothetical protein
MSSRRDFRAMTRGARAAQPVALSDALVLGGILLLLSAP